MAINDTHKTDTVITKLKSEIKVLSTNGVNHKLCVSCIFSLPINYI